MHKINILFEVIRKVKSFIDRSRYRVAIVQGFTGIDARADLKGLIRYYTTLLFSR